AVGEIDRDLIVRAVEWRQLRVGAPAQLVAGLHHRERAVELERALVRVGDDARRRIAGLDDQDHDGDRVRGQERADDADPAQGVLHRSGPIRVAVTVRASPSSARTCTSTGSSPRVNASAGTSTITGTTAVACAAISSGAAGATCSRPGPATVTV